jgi:hypothetical protein
LDLIWSEEIFRLYFKGLAAGSHLCQCGPDCPQIHHNINKDSKFRGLDGFEGFLEGKAGIQSTSIECLERIRRDFRVVSDKDEKDESLIFEHVPYNTYQQLSAWESAVKNDFVLIEPSLRESSNDIQRICSIIHRTLR